MTSTAKTLLLLFLLAFLLLLALCPRACRADEWYTPQAADFHPLYNRDTADHQYQQWDGRDSYWYWVQTFYNGYSKRVLGVSVVRQIGWTAKGRAIVAHINNEPARQQIMADLNKLGRAVAGEWAKSSHVCRISTGDLKRYGNEISQAQGRDSGNGQAILAEVRTLQAEVDTRLKTQP